jgi:hypothetical protein
VAKAGGRTGVVQAGAVVPATDGNGNENGGAVGSAPRGRGASAAPTLLDGSIADGDTTDAFQIHVPTTVDLAPNLKGNLLLETGDMDNNVHPANTIRLVNALIKANKRFDFMLLPGKPHGYGDDTPYTTA